MQLEAVNIYRIVHKDNMEYILQNGMFCKKHASFDTANIFIGDSALTEQRHDFVIPVVDCGNLGDYVPFYFGYRSPMLYNIYTGYRGITQRPQSEIVYIVCKFHRLVEGGFNIIFTDGHAKNQVTRFFTNTEDLNQLDWLSINALTWYNTAEMPDRMRRKQAECLVKSSVPPQYIAALVVFDEATKKEMEKLVEENNQSIGVYVNPSGVFYY